MQDKKQEQNAAHHNAGQHSGGQRNEGEGNKTAAREYNESQRRFVESGKVEEKAREAEKALDSDRQELERAEAIGKRHSHGEDPALKR
jgi:hypothetical protein